ncbi:MAG: SDR family NAD(P)-dependent oxidoreductase [Microbacterium sp.]|uniref:SDR family NAD(P)-dependent oxidoreductase n=1 Tax=Microbacterium sp. TaxID=51671 RepID=UPI0039E6662A
MQDFEWQTSELSDQSGRTFVVTGASSGVGLEVAKALLAANGTVIAGVRDPAKMTALLPQLGPSDGEGRLVVRSVDVADLRSIDAFAAGLERDGFVLDALVNNAGITTSTFETSPDGIELTFATNLIGPARLTENLLPLLTATDPRVVLVGSNFSQRTAKAPDLTAVGNPSSFSQLGTYQASKIAAAAYAVSLGQRLTTAGSRVRSVIAHPGVAATAMATQADNAVTKAIAKIVVGRIARQPSDSARSVIWSATSPDVEQGVFVGPDIKRRLTVLRAVLVRGAAADPAFQARVNQFIHEHTPT